MLDHARRHHDRAFQQDDRCAYIVFVTPVQAIDSLSGDMHRVQLEIALDFYRQALVYLPGKRAIMTRCDGSHFW